MHQRGNIMPDQNMQKLKPVGFDRVHITGGFWAERQRVNSHVTLPIEYRQCKDTGRIDAFRLEWSPDSGEDPPHVFWDSDVAKWIEAAAYSLVTHPDPELEERVDQVVDLIAAAQQSDGYLNVHFTVAESENRWANLRDRHELYCAGHLMEAAVAYARSTAKEKLLEVMCRYADYIDEVFGPDEGQKRGYPGHEEIELALVRLYRFTGEERYLDLAKFFVDERGRQPHHFDREAADRGEDPAQFHFSTYQYNQSHKPLREQENAVGHAVRAMYLYSGAADVAAETGDQELMAALRGLWRSATRRRMYVTGGIGSAAQNEGFTEDFDLPNESAYAETCAAVALVFFAHRMLQIEVDGQYADVMEQALYNGAISGVSLQGDRFFYENPLTSAGDHHRKQWFGCACCPPNIARLLASVGGYVYSTTHEAIYAHLFVEGDADLEAAGQRVRLVSETNYPWDEMIRWTVHPDESARFALAVRIPGWCRGAELSVNGDSVDIGSIKKNGYARIEREWREGDRVELVLPMPVERMEARPEVREDAWRMALQRGPVVYCLEEVDNGRFLDELSLPCDGELTAEFRPGELGGVTVVTGQAFRRGGPDWDDQLYRPLASRPVPTSITAVPYFAWDNREPGEMLVWIPQRR
jgi:hypothetical protein